MTAASFRWGGTPRSFRYDSTVTILSQRAAGPPSLDELRKSIESRYGDGAPKALELYGLASSDTEVHSGGLYGSPSDQWATDTSMRCPTVLQALWHDAAGFPVWTYEFDRAIPRKPTMERVKGGLATR